MTSTQFPSPATSYPLSFQSTAASLPSFFTRRPLFSITCSLFSQNTRGGGTRQNPPFPINNFQTLFLGPVQTGGTAISACRSRRSQACRGALFRAGLFCPAFLQERAFL